RGGIKQLFIKSKSFFSQFIRAIGQGSPNASGFSDFFRYGTKSLDHYGTFITDFFQCLFNTFPIHITGTGCATVTFIALHVTEPFFTDFSDGGGDILFFNIAVEGIQCNFKVWVVNFFDNGKRLVRRIYHVTFKSIQWLQAKSDSMFLGKICGLMQIFDAPLPFLLFLFIRDKTGFAYRRIQRSSKNGATHHGRDFNTIFDILQALLTDSRVSAGYVAIGSKRTTNSHREPGILNGLLKLWPINIHLFYRNFDQVEAHVLDLLDQMKRIIVKGRNPQKCTYS